MLCNFCKSNPSQYKFFVNIEGEVLAVNLCEDCLGVVRDKISDTFNEIYEQMQPIEQASKEEKQSFVQENISPFMDIDLLAEEISSENNPLTKIDVDIGEDIRRRRKLNEMSAELEQAIKREDYEGAAGIRDKILEQECGTAHLSCQRTPESKGE